MPLPTRATRVHTITFPRAIDVASSVAPIGRWGDDLLDRWDGTTLIRTAIDRVTGEHVPYVASIGHGVFRSIDVRLPSLAATATAPVVDEISDTFAIDDRALPDVIAGDDRVAALARRYPGVVPVLWRDPFAALIRSISAQQVNLRWASTVRRRLAQRYGRRLEIGTWSVCVLDARALADADVAQLREMQLTTAKSRSVIAVAQASRAGELRRDDLVALDDDALIAHLTALPGIGRWSAEWFLARTLGRPRVVAGDLGVRKAVARLYDMPQLPSEAAVRRATSHWGAAATLVQALALHDLALDDPRRANAR